MNNNASNLPLSLLSTQPGRFLSVVRAAVRRLCDSMGLTAWEARGFLYIALRSLREGKPWRCGGDYLARVLDVSRRSADRLIHLLEDLGHLKILYRGDRHTPRLVWFELVPSPRVHLARLWKERGEIDRRWRPELSRKTPCPHRAISDRPPPHNFTPVSHSSDPAPHWRGSIAPDWMKAAELYAGKWRPEHHWPLHTEPAERSDPLFSPPLEDS